MPTYELLSLFCIASLSKYLKGYSFGVPVVILQQSPELDQPKKDCIEVLFDGPNFRDVGTKNERYGTVGVKVAVNTSLVPTDPYYHTRIKAKVSQALLSRIPLQKIGGSDTSVFDKSIIGYLKPLDTQALEVTPFGVSEPDASEVHKVFEINLC